MRKILPLLLYLAVVNQSHANTEKYFPEPKLSSTDASSWNVVVV